MQAWMRKEANPPSRAGDLPALAAAFDKMVGMAPAGYANWASISKDGASAARAGDLRAAQRACSSCHDQYKRKYKDEMRSHPLP